MLLRQLKQQCGSWVYGIGGALWRMCQTTPKEPKEIKTILILNLLRIGDTVVTLPTLEALRQLYPDAKITLVVRSLVKSLLENNPHIDELITHAGDNSKTSCQELVPQLPATDLAVILDTSPWVSWAAHQSGVQKIVAYNTLNRAFAATHRLPAPPMWNVAVPDYKKEWQVLYQGQAWYALAVSLGAPAKEVAPILELSQDVVDKARAWLVKNKIESDFILCHPGSSPSYLWGEKKFKEFINQQKYPVVLGGAPNEKELCEGIAKNTDAKVYAEAKQLSDYAALISLAKHVVSVDTSAAHMAAAVGVPITVLFGPGDPKIWGPRGISNVHIVQANTPCVGCKAAECFNKTHECMDKISVDQVLNTI